MSQMFTSSLTVILEIGFCSRRESKVSASINLVFCELISCFKVVLLTYFVAQNGTNRPSKFKICPENAQTEKIDHFLISKNNYTHSCNKKQFTKRNNKQEQEKWRMKNEQGFRKNDRCSSKFSR